MSKTIVIDPVTRIEGHAKITIHLDDGGEVQNAFFHVTQLRGFEKFAEGRPFAEMPSLMSRICGICPVSHLIASAKACDMLMAVQIPPVAAQLRRIINLAQIAQSHALSFFYLSCPDFVFGMDGDPKQRNIVGLAQNMPELIRDGIHLRKTGQTIIELLGDKKIHPGWVVAGGVNKPLSKTHRQEIQAMLPDAIAIAEKNLQWFIEQMPRFAEEISAFAKVESMYMSLQGKDGKLETYDGSLCLTDSSGNAVVSGLASEDYGSIIEEKITPNSYLKSPYYKPHGFPKGMYRVGPLARLHNAQSCGTPRADKALTQFKQLNSRSSFYYHYARLIEILYAFEKIEQILANESILDDHVRAHASPNAYEGFGVAEAPRGTLMHHYKIDKNGLITYADLVIATGHNNLAMNSEITETARFFIKNEKFTEGILNRVEAAIRAYDPCLSCSTHAFGQMPLHIELRSSAGTLLDDAKR